MHTAACSSHCLALALSHSLALSLPARLPLSRSRSHSHLNTDVSDQNTAEQDTFETPDVPPQPVEEDLEARVEPDAPEVNSAPLHAARQTQRRFADASLDLSHADHSGTLQGQRRYRSPNDVFVLQGVTTYELGSADDQPSGRPRETPLQRFMRLQSELAELSEEVAAKVATGEAQLDGGSGAPVSASALQASLVGLQKHLVELREATPASRALLDAGEAVSALARSQSQLSERLLAEVRSVQSMAAGPGAGDKAGSAAAAPAPASGGSATGPITYEVFFSPAHARLQQLSTLGDVERRLASLEQLVGPRAAPDAGALGSVVPAGADLQSAVVALDMKLTLLDDERLKALQRRLAGVASTLNELLEKRAAIPEQAGAEQNVTALLGKMTRWDALVAEIPDLIDRLQALARLHGEAANFGAALERIEGAQTDLDAAIKSQANLLHKLESSVASNVETIAKNIAALDTRLGGLRK